ncbi:hypothetical protein ACFE04_028878 [Oxalis oulophora]
MFILILFFALGFFLLLSFLITSLNKTTTPFYGPKTYPLVGCLFSFYQNRRRLLNWYTDLLSQSPSQTIVVKRFGARRTIVTANAQNVEHILKSSFHNYPKGKPFTDILGDLLGCGIFNVDGDLWSVQRKLASHEFSTKYLREFVVKIVKEEVDFKLLPLLEEAAIKGRAVDLQDLLKRFAFNVVCKISLGFDPLLLDLSRTDPPIVKAFETSAMLSAMRGMAPIYLVWKFKRALNIGKEKKLKEAINLVHESVMEIIQNKKKVVEEYNSRGDLLSRLLLAGHGEEVIRDMVISFIMAGRDTTSSAMTWLFWLLYKDENAQDSILEESTNTGLEFEGLKEMNYLKACLCESMRLYPPVAWDSKHATNDDVLPDGTSVRQGDRVTYFPYGMGRMETLWGKDRFEFKPDRWFNEPNGTILKNVNPFVFPVFQAGPRMCLGKDMAFIQMKYVVASVLRKFKIEPVNSNQPAFVPLLTAHMAGGLNVMIKRRSGHVLN